MIKEIKKGLLQFLIIQIICMMFLSLSYLPACAGEGGGEPKGNLYSLYGVEVDLICPEEIYCFDSEKFEVMVENTGFLPETINITVESWYQDKLVGVGYAELENVKRGEIIECYGKIPNINNIQDEDFIKYIARATVKEDSTIKDSDEEIIRVLAPVLIISDIRFSDNNPGNGDEITVTATIINQGHWDQTIGCVVGFFVFEEPIGELELEGISIGEKKEVSITWYATEGYNRITVKIPRNGMHVNDPVYAVYNKYSEKIRVKENVNGMQYSIIIALIGIIVLISGGVFLIMKQKRAMEIG